MTASLPASAVDVAVVGNGIVGLATAAALADAGIRVAVIGAANRGQASHAAAGMLAPSVERASGPAHDFALQARDGYAAYVGDLAERSGVPISFNGRGILEIALDPAGAERLRSEVPSGSRWLDPATLARVEPALAHAEGGLVHPRDGAVDNRALLTALERLLEREPLVRQVAQSAAALTWTGERPGVRLADGQVVEAERVVLAAGAWTPLLEGLPRVIPVEPVRGQMLALAGDPVGHVVYGPGGYIVPRGGRTVVGSTMERVAFDDETTAEGLARVHAVGTAICPSLVGVPTVERWAGLRPVTPDMLPIIGVEPTRPALLYACGHSRNGILLAPLTAASITALVTGAAPPADLTPFAPARFG